MIQRSNFYLTDKEGQHFGEPGNGTCNITVYDNVDAYLRLNETVLQSITIFICTVGLVETGVAIWFLGFCIQKANAFTTYFLNLAVADFGILIALLLFSVHSVSESFQTTAACFSLLKMSVFYLFFFAHMAALYLLTVVSMERFLTVYFPIWYRSHRANSTSPIVSCLIWSFSGLMSGTIILLHYVKSYKSSVTMIRVICTGNVLILTLPVVVSAVTRFTKVCSQKNTPRMKYIAIALRLISFIFFAIPVSFFYFINCLGYTLPSRTMLIFFLLASFNSTVNPIIHYIIGGQCKHWDWKKNRRCVPKHLKESLCTVWPFRCCNMVDSSSR